MSAAHAKPRGGPQIGGAAVSAETMTVTVRDRSAESPWGSGLTAPVTRTVRIRSNCPACGAARGKPRGLTQCEDGVHYWVQVWDNLCGHIDYYTAVIEEARALAESR